MQSTSRLLKSMSPVNIYKSASAIYLTGLAKIAPRLGNPEQGLRRALASYLMVPVSTSEISVQVDEIDYSSNSESEMESHRLRLCPGEQFNRHLMQFARPGGAPRLVRQIEHVRETQLESETETSDTEEGHVPEQEHVSEHEREPEYDTEPEHEQEPEQQTEALQQLAVDHTEPESQTDPQPESQTDPQPESLTDPQTDPQPEPPQEPHPQPQTEPQRQPHPQPQTEPQRQPQTQPQEPIQSLVQHPDYLYDSDEEVDIVQSSRTALDLLNYKMKFLNLQCSEVESGGNVLQRSHNNQVYQNYEQKKPESKNKLRCLIKDCILSILIVLLSSSPTIGFIVYHQYTMLD